jgi:hypothetical protein
MFAIVGMKANIPDRTGLDFEGRRRLSHSHNSPLGYCSRCGVTWDLVNGHSVNYADGSGCFPICEECWDELTPATRLPFYLSWLSRTDFEMMKYRGRGFGEIPTYDTPEHRAMLTANILPKH